MSGGNASPTGRSHKVMVITTSPLVKTYTLQEFWDLPESSDHSKLEFDPAVPRAALWINNDTYLEPDLMYVSTALESKMDPRHWTHADIVVEVISPSNANYDRKTKADTYRAMGVREMWLIDHKRKEVEIRCFESEENATFKLADNLHSTVLPKLRIPIRSLFT